MEGTVKGRIEDMKVKQARNGNKYISLLVDGQRYAVWDQSLLSKLHVGDVVEYKAEPKGRFTELTYLEVVETGNNDLAAFNLYDEMRTRQIVRMSCIKSASTVVTGMDLMPEEKPDKTIEVAKQFEKYVFTNPRRKKKNDNGTPKEYKPDETSPVQPGQPAPETSELDEEVPF
jgi:hypothetical protein